MSYSTRKYSQHFARGLKRDHKAHQVLMRASPKFLHVPAPIPGVLDLRAKAAPPEDQLTCGCCWAFATTNALRSAYILAGKDSGALSKNFLLFNEGPGPAEHGCSGGDFQAGLNMLEGHGPCGEALSPYHACDTGTYPKSAPVIATASLWQCVGSGWKKPTAQDLCEAVYGNGKGAVLAVDVAADDEWTAYGDGIYQGDGNLQVDHMVRIVGYDAQTSVDSQGNASFHKGAFANGDGYFWVRNNWNTTWGINGDMMSRYGANNLAETAFVFSL